MGVCCLGKLCSTQRKTGTPPYCSPAAAVPPPIFHKPTTFPRGLTLLRRLCTDSVTSMLPQEQPSTPKAQPPTSTPPHFTSCTLRLKKRAFLTHYFLFYLSLCLSSLAHQFAHLSSSMFFFVNERAYFHFNLCFVFSCTSTAPHKSN